MSRPLPALLMLLAVALVASADDWPEFRGADNDGVSDEQKVVTQWDAKTNIRWKAPLPGPGNSSPIVSAGRVFVTCAEDEGRRRNLYCFDRKTGKQLWVKTVEFDKVMPTHKTNPYGGASPAADGERVVQWESSAGLHCYDFAGKKLWDLDLGEFEHIWGYGSSPIIDEGVVYLNCGPGEKLFVAAIELASGKILWKTPEPRDGKGSRNANSKYLGSWSTPLLTTVGGKKQLVCSQPTRVVSYDPKSGEILWWCDGLSGPRGDLAYSSPMISGDLCVAIGGFSGPGMGFRIKGMGDITDQRLWREERNPQSIGTGVFVDGYVYRPNAGPGTIECLDPATGEVKWSAAAGQNNWGSIVAAGGNLYLTNQDGATVLFKPNPDSYQEVAVNAIGEPSNSTPAISDGEAFLRTFKGLYCISEAND